MGIGAAQANARQVLQGLSPADFAANDGVDGFVKTYGKMLDTHKDAFRVVFEKLKEPQGGGVLFHCTGSSSNLLFLRYCLTFNLKLQIARLLLLPY